MVTVRALRTLLPTAGTEATPLAQCKKGDTIAIFLEKCRIQFPELRAVSVDNLMYIKEDLIIPHVRFPLPPSTPLADCSFPALHFLYGPSLPPPSSY